jgi:hypothetical protein
MTEDPEKELEHTADELEHERDKLDEQVGDLKEDWEAKKGSSAVPGAQEES